ncbi:hypothetical protein C2857_006764 [Epichloe festucae Fl1]|uniref:Uncharacterized protein n=1 Tax=Epichloe festucae (strain Fl1) TaxID=877507 RepID=A0A7S9KQ75_EPIFF|nr:hypothetical protein C2857_006764 [Epichloe festucae Fl1]
MSKNVTNAHTAPPSSTHGIHFTQPLASHRPFRNTYFIVKNLNHVDEYNAEDDDRGPDTRNGSPSEEEEEGRAPPPPQPKPTKTGRPAQKKRKRPFNDAWGGEEDGQNQLARRQKQAQPAPPAPQPAPAPAQNQVVAQKDEKKNPLKLRLDLNLDVEIELRAKIHGDITLALLFRLNEFIVASDDNDMP